VCVCVCVCVRVCVRTCTSGARAHARLAGRRFAPCGRQVQLTPRELELVAAVRTWRASCAGCSDSCLRRVCACKDRQDADFVSLFSRCLSEGRVDVHSAFFEFLRSQFRNRLHIRKCWSRKGDEGFLPKLLVAAFMTKSGAACMRVLRAVIEMPDKRTVDRMVERLRPKTDAPPYGFLKANLAPFLGYLARAREAAAKAEAMRTPGEAAADAAAVAEAMRSVRHVNPHVRALDERQRRHDTACRIFPSFALDPPPADEPSGRVRMLLRPECVDSIAPAEPAAPCTTVEEFKWQLMTLYPVAPMPRSLNAWLRLHPWLAARLVHCVGGQVQLSELCHTAGDSTSWSAVEDAMGWFFHDFESQLAHYVLRGAAIPVLLLQEVCVSKRDAVKRMIEQQPPPRAEAEADDACRDSEVGHKRPPKALACMVCSDTGGGDTMLLCDGCGSGTHMACMAAEQTLEAIPHLEFYCTTCAPVAADETVDGWLASRSRSRDDVGECAAFGQLGFRSGTFRS